jgi:hypothetical protein
MTKTTTSLATGLTNEPEASPERTFSNLSRHYLQLFRYALGVGLQAAHRRMRAGFGWDNDLHYCLAMGRLLSTIDDANVQP